MAKLVSQKREIPQSRTQVADPKPSAAVTMFGGALALGFVALAAYVVFLAFQATP